MQEKEINLVDYWKIAQDVLKAMGEMATIIIVIQNISK